MHSVGYVFKEVGLPTGQVGLPSSTTLASGLNGKVGVVGLSFRLCDSHKPLSWSVLLLHGSFFLVVPLQRGYIPVSSLDESEKYSGGLLYSYLLLFLLLLRHDEIMWRACSN